MMLTWAATFLTPADFEKIETKMLELARQNNTYVRKEISKADAITYFKDKNDPYKLDLLERLEDGTLPCIVRETLPIYVAAHIFQTLVSSKLPRF